MWFLVECWVLWVSFIVLIGNGICGYVKGVRCARMADASRTVAVCGRLLRAVLAQSWRYSGDSAAGNVLTRIILEAIPCQSSCQVVRIM